MANWNLPNREEALELLKKYNESESLIKHALTVEGVMRHFASLYEGEDADEWGIIGLIHDLDYEKYPSEHCHKTAEILAENNWPKEAIRAVISHGYSIVNDVEPILPIEKVLFTIDELTGLITATALMRPSKSIMDLEVKSVMKKWKQKSFAAGVNREIIEEGAKALGMSIDKVIGECIIAMQKIADDIGLAGN